MQPTIKHAVSVAEFFTEELCYITELSNSNSDEMVSIARARVEPGVTTRWHRLLETVERYVVIAGEGRVELGGLLAQQVKPGDVVLIPAMCPQRISNTGTQDLIFLAICSPRFRQQNYQDVEAEMCDQ